MKSPSDTANFRRLKAAILEKSVSKVWETAVLEWYEFKRVQLFSSEYHCLCGHAISELCYIKNRRNLREEVVGNCCIQYFIDTDSDRFFHALKRINKDIDKSANEALIIWAKKENVINEWEQTFYLSIMRKRDLSYKQSAIKNKLNNKILQHFNKCL